MGQNKSLLPVAPEGFPYFCMTFRAHDKIKILHGNSTVISIVRNAIKNHWPDGLQDERGDKGAYKFKIDGTPFCRNTTQEEAMACKRMCCVFLTNLRQKGWSAIVSSDLSRTQDLTTWFFERAKPLTTPPRILCVSLSSQDKLQLVNAPSHMAAVLRQAVEDSYGDGIVRDKEIDDDYYVQLNGNPWSTSAFKEGTSARKVLLEIFRRFEAQSFRLYTTANLKGTADCLFFHQVSDTTTQTRYVMVSLNSSDRIRLIDCPDVVDRIRDCIQQHWPHGLQDEKDLLEDFGCYEFKLRGNPWDCAGVEAVTSRLLITMMLQTLMVAGWAVLSALDISRRVNDKAVFILRSCAPVNMQHICISPNDTDKIRLINAPQDLVDLTGSTIRANWYHGVQREVTLRLMITMMLQTLMEAGWAVLSALDISRRVNDKAVFILRSCAPVNMQHICISPHDTDKIRLINAPQNLVDLTGSTIRANWCHGVQREVTLRLMITMMLQTLMEAGWAVLSALDISRRVNDKAVFILRSCAPVNMQHICISPHDTDKIRLINAPQNLVDLTGSTIRANWYHSVQRERPLASSYEWKLGGNPWAVFGGAEYAHAGHLMCSLVRGFAARGWRVICSADVSAKFIHVNNEIPDYPTDVHCWFLAYTGVPQQKHETPRNEMKHEKFRVDAPPPPDPALPKAVPPPGDLELLSIEGRSNGTLEGPN